MMLAVVPNVLFKFTPLTWGRVGAHRPVQNVETIPIAVHHAPHADLRLCGLEGVGCATDNQIDFVVVCSLRWTSHVGTLSCVKTNNIKLSTSAIAAGLGHSGGNDFHSISAINFVSKKSGARLDSGSFHGHGSLVCVFGVGHTTIATASRLI